MGTTGNTPGNEWGGEPLILPAGCGRWGLLARWGTLLEGVARRSQQSTAQYSTSAKRRWRRPGSIRLRYAISEWRLKACSQAVDSAGFSASARTRHPSRILILLSFLLASEDFNVRYCVACAVGRAYMT